MDLKLKDKVAVITGGSSGIGKATALAFAEEGCKVAICARNKERLKAMEEEFESKRFEIFTMSIDVKSETDIERFADAVISHFGQIDVWINNVARNLDSSVLEMKADDWNEMMDTNVSSCLYGTKAAAKRMKESGGGAIINTSSIASIHPSVYKSAYGASKFAVNALTEISAGELAPFGIRVNAVAPGSTNTPMARNSGRDYSKLVKSHAIQRLAEPEEIANAFLFLASEVSSYITGIILEVSGGKCLLQDCDKAYEERR